ncbi:unnamed protein product [Macrosiphum euphorbiae]|uniref:C2H2-type domain-containing protein n=1 Tax=Macrosiphum euphorbiae TaxID=13131 RepID=A0AAV0WL53_9HEMI|nr:unnamed protein product [Macrosiphum euphorbiae]
MRQVHPAENDYKSLASLKCPLCESTFNATSKLHEHIEIDHDVHLEVVSKVFESVDEFKKWKSVIEKENLAFLPFIELMEIDHTMDVIDQDHPG